MRKLMHFSHTHPVFTLIVLCIISAGAALQLPNLVIDTSLEGLNATDPVDRANYHEAVRTFGSEKINIVYIRDPLLFTPEKLALVEDLVVSLEDVPGVIKTESLFSVNNFKNESGMLVTGPLAGWVPESREAANELLKDALANPMISGNLVAASGHSLAVNLFISPLQQDPDFFKHLVRGVDAHLAPLKGEFEEVFQIGDPTLRYEISDMMVKDQKRILPLSVLVLLFTLALVTRSFGCAALPLLTSFTSILWIAGFMAVTGIPVNLLTIIVPSLVLVIGSTEDVHLLLEYEEGLHQHRDKPLAVAWMMDKMGTVVMVTALSTFLGFLSICLNDVVMLKQFGYSASFGLFVNPLITSMLTPVYLRFFGRSKPRPAEDKLPKWLPGLVDRISRHKKRILAAMVAVTLVMGCFSFRLKLENDYIAMFKESNSIVNRLNRFTAEFQGTQTFFIHIKAGHPDLFKEPENLNQIARIQEEIRRSGHFDKTTSLVDFLTLINREMNGGDHEKERLPTSKKRISQYLAFLEDDDINRYVNADFSQVNILVRHSIHNSHELKQALASLEKQIQAVLNPHFHHVFTGETILTLKGADAIADGQAKSIFLLLLIIFIIMAILFTNIKAGLLSLVPNIIPVVINFGVMGLFAIPLNVGTAMVAVIAIGIAVDDTLHFMARYNDEMHQVKTRTRP